MPMTGEQHFIFSNVIDEVGVHYYSTDSLGIEKGFHMPCYRSEVIIHYC